MFICKNLTIEKPNNGFQLDNSGERPRKSYKDCDFYMLVLGMYSVNIEQEC